VAYFLKPDKWRTQPPGLARIDWGHPITKGLSFCAVPVGNTFLDLVSRDMGVVTGTTTPTVLARGDGRSRVDFARAVYGNGVSGTKVEWPVSIARGGAAAQECTILALGGATESVDGKKYSLVSNTDNVGTGNGFGLAIDSYQSNGRGNIIRSDYSSSIGYSTELLGTNFENQLHYFGYALSGNGTNGDWLYSGTNTTWSGGTTHGTTTTNRRARIFTAGLDSAQSSAGIVALAQIWDRRLSVAEYAALYDNPWQLFRKDTARVIFAPSTGGPATFSGSGAATLPLVTASGAGKKTRSGTGATTLPLVTASGAGKKTRSGSGASTLPLPTASGSGSVDSGGTFSGSGSATLPLLTASGTAKRALKGSGAPSLPSLTGSGAGKKSRAGSGAATLPVLTATGAGKKARPGTGAPSLPLLTGAGAGEFSAPGTGSGSPSIPLLTASGSGNVVALPREAAPGGKPIRRKAKPHHWFSAADPVRLPVSFIGSGAASLPMLSATGTGETRLDPEKSDVELLIEAAEIEIQDMFAALMNIAA
jgi:hypothetical protein